MDPTGKAIPAALTSTMFSWFLSMFLPGGLAAFIYYRAACGFSSGVGAFVGQHSDVRVAVLVAFSVFLGLIIEELGSRLEVLIDWKCLGEADRRNWRTYLQSSFAVEPVGQRYLQSILVRMKFELNSTVAFIAVLPVLWLALLVHGSGITLMIGSYVFAVACIAYLFLEAISSAKHLALIRGLLVDGVEDRPVAQESNLRKNIAVKDIKVAPAKKKVRTTPLAKSKTKRPATR